MNLSSLLCFADYYDLKKIIGVYFLILLFHCQLTEAAKIDSLDIPSTAMGKTYKSAVVLPASYEKSKSVYPVFYLLHGGFGHYRDWLNKTPDKLLLHRLADSYDLIIVLPEGEVFSYYIDSPVDRKSHILLKTLFLQLIKPIVPIAAKTQGLYPVYLWADMVLCICQHDTRMYSVLPAA